MGPIEKKILELSKTEGLSEETIMALTILKNQIKDDERRLANNAYEKGYHDKEMRRSPTWNYFENKYSSYLSNIKFGQIS